MNSINKQGPGRERAVRPCAAAVVAGGGSELRGEAAEVRAEEGRAEGNAVLSSQGWKIQFPGFKRRHDTVFLYFLKAKCISCKKQMVFHMI